MGKQFDLRLGAPPRVSGFFFEPGKIWAATIEWDLQGRFGESYDPKHVSFKSLDCANAMETSAAIATYMHLNSPSAAASATTTMELSEITNLIKFGKFWIPEIEYWGLERLESFWDMNEEEAIATISDLMDVPPKNYGNLVGPWLAYGVAIAKAFDDKTQEQLLGICPVWQAQPKEVATAK